MMDQDKIELIIIQLLALIELWHILRSSSLSPDSREKIEELLLEILENKQRELAECAHV